MKLSMAALAAALVLGTAGAGRCAPPPAPAARLVAEAAAAARAHGKSVMVIFHATWCGWCKRLDKVMEEPALKKVIDARFVVAHLDVMERGEPAKTVENPGGMKLLGEWGGQESGLPFMVILNAAGRRVADSNAMPKTPQSANPNIGYPGLPAEIEAFVSMLKKGAPKLTAAEADTVRRVFTKNAPSASGH